MTSNFDDEELAIAANHASVALLVHGLADEFTPLCLSASTLEQAGEYVLASDGSAFSVKETINSPTGKGFLYHAHEHLERRARERLGVLVADIPLNDERVLAADRTARLAEAKLESLLYVWLSDQHIPWEHFLWTLTITGDPSTFSILDERKSKAVATGLGVPKPAGIDRDQVLSARRSVWGWTLSGLGDLSRDELAYARWRMRGRHHGDDWQDWFAALHASSQLKDPAQAEGNGNLDPWTI